MRTFKQTGFTMVELMIAIVVLAILLAAAVPSFRTIIENNRRTTTLNGLLSAFQLARTEAVKRSDQVTICQSDTGINCTSADGWEGGWIVFSDLNGNGTADSLVTSNCGSNDECLLRVSDTVEGGIIIANAPNAVTYLPNGTVVATGQFDIIIEGCTEAGRARQIQITATGRPEVTETNCPSS